MRPFQLIFAVLVIAQTASVVFAVDVVHLNSGRRLYGDITAHLDDGVTLQTPTATMHLPRTSYRAISREDRPEWYLAEGTKLPDPKAVELYERGTAAHPNDRAILSALLDTYVKLARTELRGGTLSAARMYFNKALAFDNDIIEARQGLRSCDVLERRSKGQIEGLKHELEKHPDNDYARFQLGMAYERIGQVQQAYEQYQRIIRGKMQFKGGVEKIAELRAFLDASIIILPESPLEEANEPDPSEIGPARQMESEYFIIMHHDEDLAREAAAVADETYADVLKLLGNSTPADPDAPRATIHLVPTRAQFAQATGSSVTTGHATVAGDIYIYAPYVDAIRSTVRHEVAHMAAYRTVGKLPVWADEGLAIRQEPDCWTHYITMRQAVRQKAVLPINALLSVRNINELPNQKAVELFYQQTFTFVDYLVEERGGIDKLIEFARAAQLSPADAARRVYQAGSLEELQKQWMEFVGM